MVTVLHTHTHVHTASRVSRQTASGAKRASRRHPNHRARKEAKERQRSLKLQLEQQLQFERLQLQAMHVQQLMGDSGSALHAFFFPMPHPSSSLRPHTHTYSSARLLLCLCCTRFQAALAPAPALARARPAAAAAAVVLSNPLRVSWRRCLSCLFVYGFGFARTTRVKRRRSRTTAIRLTLPTRRRVMRRTPPSAGASARPRIPPTTTSPSRTKPLIEKRSPPFSKLQSAPCVCPWVGLAVSSPPSPRVWSWIRSVSFVDV